MSLSSAAAPKNELMDGWSNAARIPLPWNELELKLDLLASRRAVVVPQQSAQSLPTKHFASGPADVLRGFDEAIVEPLVIPFAMIMDQELIEASPQRLLAEEDHPLHAFRFQRAEESLQVGIQVRTSRRQQYYACFGVLFEVLSQGEELHIAINNQVARIA